MGKYNYDFVAVDRIQAVSRDHAQEEFAKTEKDDFWRSAEMELVNYECECGMTYDNEHDLHENDFIMHLRETEDICGNCEYPFVVE